MFYWSVVHCIFTVVSWGDGNGNCGTNKLNKMDGKASSVVGMEQGGLETVREKRTRGKLDNPSLLSMPS